MSQIIDLFVRLSTTLWAYLETDIPGDFVARYMAYGFALGGILIIISFLMYLFPLIIKHVFSIFRRWSR